MPTIANREECHRHLINKIDEKGAGCGADVQAWNPSYSRSWAGSRQAGELTETPLPIEEMAAGLV